MTLTLTLHMKNYIEQTEYELLSQNVSGITIKPKESMSSQLSNL